MEHFIHLIYRCHVADAVWHHDSH